MSVRFSIGAVLDQKRHCSGLYAQVGVWGTAAMRKPVQGVKPTCADGVKKGRNAGRVVIPLQGLGST